MPITFNSKMEHNKYTLELFINDCIYFLSFGESNMCPFPITPVFFLLLNGKHKEKNTRIINPIAFQVCNLYCT
jgi:hypothetical protein